MIRRLNKKGSIAAISIVAVLALAAGAYAYFTSQGSGTGTVAVGNASAWTVTTQTATGGPLLPGSGTMNIPFSVTNPSSGNQDLTGVTATVVSDANGYIVHSGTSVTGCLASWFQTTVTPPTLGDMAGSATATGGSVAVTMTDAGVSQNHCQGATPDVTITAS